MTFDLTNKRVFVAGHRGMVGSALVRRLENDGITSLTATRQECDLVRQAEVDAWFAAHEPQVVVLAAAKVGGILANSTYPADFLYDNLMIEANVIHAAHRHGVEKLLFLGSSCIYPRLAPQPISEDSLLTGPLEATNEAYAIAKIAGIKLCEAYRRQHGRDFISAMPTNLYGPNDNYDLQTSHVLPALVRKVHEAKRAGAKEVVLWGSGTPLREFMHVDDLADACVFLLKVYSDPRTINIGCGEDLSIRSLAEKIAKALEWEGRFVYDSSKPDGTPRKLMDSARLFAAGWRPKISLDAGIRDAYAWYLASLERREGAKA